METSKNKTKVKFRKKRGLPPPKYQYLNVFKHYLKKKRNGKILKTLIIEDSYYVGVYWDERVIYIYISQWK